MSDPRDQGQNQNRDGDLYDSDMGKDVTGGNVKYDQGKPNQDHHNVHGPGAHHSWDTDSQGNVSGNHGTLHQPDRPW